jgi:AGZA family xanthine/uracil permease-like MFS transporter
MTTAAQTNPIHTEKYQWFKRGDISAFFALMPDNLATLAMMAGILMGAFGFPGNVVFGRMIPGTAFGVLVGDSIYTWLAIRLAKRTGNNTVSAIPLGLDTPSSIGIALAVLGPAFIAMKQHMSVHDAAMSAWVLGMGCMLLIGLFKLGMAFCGNWIHRTVPQAGLLGSLAGVGIALIAFVPMANLYGQPVAGLISLGIVLFSLVANARLPKNLPGVITAIIVGAAIYHGMGLLNLTPATYTAPDMEYYFHLPIPTLSCLDGIKPALGYLPIILPFALLTVIGGIDVSESANAVGDRYNTRSILLTEAFSTLVAAFFGGVAQTTPYAGYPAYKQMKCRAGYTLLTGVFIGLGGMLGYVSFFVELIPDDVLAPILIFLGMLITAQPFQCAKNKYAPAIVLAMLPSIARLLTIYFSNPEYIPAEHLAKLMETPVEGGFPFAMIVFALGNGFILTGMLWGGFLSEMIDHRFNRSLVYLAILALLSFFGVIHSPTITGEMVFPWQLSGLERQVPIQFAIGYLIMGAVIFLLSRRPTYAIQPEASAEEIL